MDVNKIVNDFLVEIDSNENLEAIIQEFKTNIHLRNEVWGKDLREISNNTNVYDRLLNYSYDLALKALNSNDSRKYLFDSIMFLIIENFFIDYRDSYIRLAIISHVAAKKKITDQEILQFVREYSSENAIKHFERFFSQKKAERSLKAFGLQEKKSGNEVNIIEIPPLWMG
jgi:hypothetical protein